MKAIRRIVCGAAISLSAISQAHALNTRTWISGGGTDAVGCGPIANPCRSLQYAHDNTSAGGEIDIKDAGGYGSLVITRSISIINDGVGVAGVIAPGGGAAITIDAPSANVILRGLTIEGAENGETGVDFRNGFSLVIDACAFFNFTGNGIDLRPPAGASFVVTINNVTVVKAIGWGITLANQTYGLGRVSISRSLVSRSSSGIGMYGGGQTSVSISSTVVTSTAGGIILANSPSMMLDGVVAHGNINAGILMTSGTALLGRSSISGNDQGIKVTGGTFYSYGTNQINANVSDIVGNVLSAPQR